jgi:glutamine amidotransferase/cyclase
VRAVERLLARGGVPDGTSAIESIAAAYGRQAVVVSVDPRRAFVDPATYAGPHALVHGAPGTPDAGKAWWYQCTVSGGREARPLSVVQLAEGAARLGAGELLVNSIDRDGTGAGFDADLLRMVRAAVRIPVVASSGAGTAQHFVDVFADAGVESALAAGIFHREEVSIAEVKVALVNAGISARTDDADVVEVSQ